VDAVVGRDPRDVVAAFDHAVDDGDMAAPDALCHPDMTTHSFAAFRGFDVPAGHFLRDCAFMFRVRDGLITDRWAIRDDLAMMTQLGAITARRPEDVLQGTVTSYRDDPFSE
jgi:ketosteroid isomerase-like protein